MVWRKILSALPALLLALSPAGAAAAGTLDYDIGLGPLRLGLLSLDSRTQGKAGYRARLTIRSTGLAGLVRAVLFEAVAEGLLGPLPRPLRYHESADTGRRVTETALVWRGGLPERQSYRTTPPETAAPPAPEATARALDPASAFLAALAGAQACDLAFPVFDGQRLAALTLDPAGPGPSPGAVGCDGRLTRLAGYAPRDLAERREFPLRLTYVAEGAGFVLVAAEVQTLYGKVWLKRR